MVRYKDLPLVFRRVDIQRKTKGRKISAMWDEFGISKMEQEVKDAEERLKRLKEQVLEK